jgi:hypothetical protein
MSQKTLFVLMSHEITPLQREEAPENRIRQLAKKKATGIFPDGIQHI